VLATLGVVEGGRARRRGRGIWEMLEEDVDEEEECGVLGVVGGVRRR